MKSIVTGQLIICDDIINDFENKLYTLQNLRNSIDIKTFPAVVVVKMLVKLVYKHTSKPCWIEIRNEKNEIVYKSPNIKLSIEGNSKRMWRDMAVPIRFVAIKEGMFNIELYFDDSIIYEYPFKVNKAIN